MRRRWVISFVVLLTMVLLSLAVDRGYLLSPRELVQHLADRPEVGPMFRGPSTDRFDATVFLFTVLVVTPLAIIAGLVALGVALIMIEITVVPAGRRLGIPDSVMHALVLIAAIAGVYAQSPVWVPGSIKLLGLVARAYLLALT